MRLVDVVMGALAQALPEPIPAASQGTMNNVALGSVSGDSAVFHTKHRDRKPVNRQVPGAARRQGWLPWQELQRSNCLFTGFPAGATRKASAALRCLEIAPLSRRQRALHLSFLVASISVFSMKHCTSVGDATGVTWDYYETIGGGAGAGPLGQGASGSPTAYDQYSKYACREYRNALSATH